MATTMQSYSSLVLVLLFLCNTSLSNALKGFSVEMMHRDSEKSPFYLPSETHSQRVAKAIQRSIARVNHLTKPSASLDTVESTVIPNSGEYLMTYSVGTPPFKILGIVDTGSNIVWLQCKPCTDCYEQTSPIFDPRKSRTYKNLPCTSSACRAAGASSSCSEKCEYTINYGDGSHSTGDLSVDTITLSSTEGSPVKFRNIAIGCGHDNTGTFQANGSGIVGLSGGATSLISQLGSTIEGKFSYCLAPFFSGSKSTSKLSFGDAAVLSGKGVVSTPLIKQEGQIFFFLTLESFTVGRKKVAVRGSSSGPASEGNIIIDSGTTLTLLPSDVYEELESAVADAVNLERASDPSGFLSLCYESDSNSEQGIPVITAHFRGADVDLKAVNTFIEVGDGVICLAFRASEDLSIFGNVAQQNFVVGYDLQKQTVSFKPKDCSKG
ncbi:aspartic proteinase CDR1-like [Vigna unguiculata]|uniref:aspartic proteinase CDR1-like n=1 Tax=Vigna unguiculata TaxID=3917 RepID=UPI001016759B|nr:aspartic proteinase CDR1-like [Vigna unguiculata]